MKTKAFFALALLLFLFGCPQEIIPRQGTSSTVTITSMVVSQETIGVREEISVEVVAESESGVKSIGLSAGEKNMENPCDNKKCTAVFSFSFESTGVIQLSARAVSQSGGTTTKNKKIYVVEKGKKCSDGTVFGQCSKAIPFYCENGTLSENCSKCGCIEPLECFDELSCQVKKGAIELTGIESIDGGFLRPGSTARIALLLQNKSGKRIEGIGLTAVLELECSGSLQAQQTNSFVVEALEAGQETSKAIEAVLGEECIYSAKASLFNVGTEELMEENALSVFAVQELIEAKNDSTAPSQPQGLNVKSDGSTAMLSWTKNQEPDLKEYRVYKSNNISPGYVTYALFASVPGKENELLAEGLKAGEHYFRIAAVDFFGNESEKSNAAKTETN